MKEETIPRSIVLAAFPSPRYMRASDVEKFAVSTVVVVPFTVRLPSTTKLFSTVTSPVNEGLDSLAIDDGTTDSEILLLESSPATPLATPLSEVGI